MKVVAVTIEFLAKNEASAYNRAASIRAIDEFKDCVVRVDIEDASLEDEDAILGTERAAAMRCMDALRRTSMQLLIEVAKEVRDCPHRAATENSDEESLPVHLRNLFAGRIRAALDTEFPDVTDKQHEAAMEAVIDWASGPTALADVQLDDYDCGELAQAYCAEWGGFGPPLHEQCIYKFCFDGSLGARVPRLAAMADDVYNWLKACSVAHCWLPSPDAVSRARADRVQDRGLTCTRIRTSRRRKP